VGKRIPFEEYYPINEDYKRFDGRKTAFSIKRQLLGAETFSYTKKVWDKMRAGAPGFSHPDISFKNAANTSDNSRTVLRRSQRWVHDDGQALDI